MRVTPPEAAAIVPGWLRVVNAVLGAGTGYVALRVLALMVRAGWAWADGALLAVLLIAVLAFVAGAAARVAWTGRPHAGALSTTRQALFGAVLVTAAAFKDRALRADPRLDPDAARLRALLAAAALWLALAAIWRWYARGRRPSDSGAGSAA